MRKNLNEYFLRERKIDYYLSLESVKDKMNFILNSFGLEGPFLVGTLKKTASGAIIIVDLIDPYKQIRLEKKIVEEAAITNTAYYGMGNNKDDVNAFVDEKVLFKFRPDETVGKQGILERGNVLRVVYGSIEIINRENINDLKRKIGIEPDIAEHSPDLKVIKNKKGNIYYNNAKNSNLIKGNISKKNKGSKSIDLNMSDLLKKQKKQLENREKNLIAKEEQITKIIEKLTYQEQELVERERFLEELGLIEKKRSSLSIKPEGTFKVSQINHDLIQNIQQYIFTNTHDHLKYETEVIENFTASLQTNQMIILSGSSGTGKTSLISAFSKSVGASFKVIPVQSSWLDRQDLLGYLNPLSKIYVSTPFLDAIKEAKNDEERLYIICLDEINLAQIEYYLADLLSLREHQEGIPLYSKQEYSFYLEEIKWYVKNRYNLRKEDDAEKLLKANLKINDKDIFKYSQRYNNLRKYGHNLNIPKNVRIVGTMNVDGTTKPLSPKVIDRSFIFEINKQNINLEMNKDLKEVFVPAENWSLSNLKIDETDFIKKLKEINSLLKECNAEINSRTEKHIYYLEISYNNLKKDPMEVHDLIIMGKVLPKINIFIDDTFNTHYQIQNEIEKLVGKKSKSYNKVTEMIAKSEVTNVFTYWG
ncbi:McrB family protein [Jeotgalibacillus haloalkalitolerans]|uniref:AAA family ATPase n=1 Tax=Jeotgalibacillus haloalkalitolerans TaxID=3104292 RepID=A0ABU5KKA7_9BACL|nr:AAA family ATPase [Jeotgalibacillus sp. HH7-29]MDZ5711371.1 AAA family ATPase [Jeotgalibacillus sp. HH7-29]